MSIYLTDEEMDEQGRWHDEQRTVAETQEILDDFASAMGTEQTCCDGTGYTGNPSERCAEHYDIPGFGSAGLY